MGERERSELTQVYWRIRRADGKYFAADHIGTRWVDSLVLATPYSQRPYWASTYDPTARVVKVTVRRKEKAQTEPKCGCRTCRAKRGVR